MEATFAEQFRCECADRGVKPPRLFQEEPAIFRNSLMAGEDMVERGRVSAVWMTALGGLIELLRVAEKDQGFRGL